MDFSGFFGQNLIVVFFFLCLGIFIRSEMSELQKMMILYLCTYTACLLKVLPIWGAVVSVISMQFIYGEYLTEDDMKIKVITGIKYKLLDFIFRFLIIYYTWLFVIALLLQSHKIKLAVGGYWKLPYCFSILFMLILMQRIGARKFQIYSYTDLMKQFQKYPMKNFPKDMDRKKLNILVDIEDKSYFSRRSTYNLISGEFLKYKFPREAIQVFSQLTLRDQWAMIHKYFKRAKNIRGYSTIEMQLMRSIGLESGYNCVWNRKIYELFYTWIFLPSLKKYYEDHSATGAVKFKDYLIWVYYNTVPVTLKDKKYSRFAEAFGCEIENWTREQIFVATLALSGKPATGWTLELYYDIIGRYDLSIPEIKALASRNVFRSLNSFELTISTKNKEILSELDRKEIQNLLETKIEKTWSLQVGDGKYEWEIPIVIKTGECLILSDNIAEYLERTFQGMKKYSFTYTFG